LEFGDNNMSGLLPWLKVNITPLMNIETLDREDVPEEPGVYVMLSDHTKYAYPLGESQVYYIGKSKNLRKRIITHKRHCKELTSGKRDTRYKYYWARYEYAGSHGCNVGLTISKTDKDAKKMEDTLLDDFAEYYGAKPVANG
jgi:hypothetical protein